jgi:hypothetical protein
MCVILMPRKSANGACMSGVMSMIFLIHASVEKTMLRMPLPAPRREHPVHVLGAAWRV